MARLPGWLVHLWVHPKVVFSWVLLYSPELDTHAASPVCIWGHGNGEGEVFRSSSAWHTVLICRGAWGTPRTQPRAALHCSSQKVCHSWGTTEAPLLCSSKWILSEPGAVVPVRSQGLISVFCYKGKGAQQERVEKTSRTQEENPARTKGRNLCFL